MIKNKEDYKRYLEVDKTANEYKMNKPRLFGNEIWKFLIALRTYEYHLNCMKPGYIKKIVCLWDKLIWHRLSVKTGISIYPNSFEEGLTIWHYGCIVVNGTARGGKFVTLQNGVNVAEHVRIGDNCYLAPGVKVAKNVSIPDNCIIGYNSVVVRSLDSPNATYVGIPVKKIKEVGYVVDGRRLQI